MLPIWLLNIDHTRILSISLLIICCCLICNFLLGKMLFIKYFPSFSISFFLLFKASSKKIKSFRAQKQIGGRNKQHLVFFQIFKTHSFQLEKMLFHLLINYSYYQFNCVTCSITMQVAF